MDEYIIHMLASNTYSALSVLFLKHLFGYSMISFSCCDTQANRLAKQKGDNILPKEKIVWQKRGISNFRIDQAIFLTLLVNVYMCVHTHSEKKY